MTEPEEVEVVAESEATEDKPKRSGATVTMGTSKLSPTINWDKIRPANGQWKKRETKPIGKTKNS